MRYRSSATSPDYSALVSFVSLVVKETTKDTKDTTVNGSFVLGEFP